MRTPKTIPAHLQPWPKNWEPKANFMGLLDEACGDGCTLADVRNGLGIQMWSAKNALARLVKAGEIERDGEVYFSKNTTKSPASTKLESDQAGNDEPTWPASAIRWALTEVGASEENTEELLEMLANWRNTEAPTPAATPPAPPKPAYVPLEDEKIDARTYVVSILPDNAKEAWTLDQWLEAAQPQREKLPPYLDCQLASMIERGLDWTGDPEASRRYYCDAIAPDLTPDHAAKLRALVGYYTDAAKWRTAADKAGLRLASAWFRSKKTRAILIEGFEETIDDRAGDWVRYQRPQPPTPPREMSKHYFARASSKHTADPEAEPADDFSDM